MTVGPVGQVFSSWSNILIRSTSWEERVRSISVAHHKIIVVSHPLVTTGSPWSTSERLNSKLASLPRDLFVQPAGCRLTVMWGSEGKASKATVLFTCKEGGAHIPSANPSMGAKEMLGPVLSHALVPPGCLCIRLISLWPFLCPLGAGDSCRKGEFFVSLFNV